MHVLILGPAQWRPILALAEDDVRPQVKKLARAILQSLHDRHIGVTPRLAVALAEVMQAPVQRRLDTDAGVWQLVVRRLEHELAEHSEAQSRQQPYRLAVNTVSSWFVVQLAAQLVQRACERAERCYLFAAHAGDDDVKPVDALSLHGRSPLSQHQDYRDYDAALEQHLRKFLSDSSFPAPYWLEQALLASDGSRRAVMTVSTPGAAFLPNCDRLPNCDSDLLSLLLRLRPKREISKRRRNATQHATAVGRRHGIRPPQDGVVGFHLTRRLEDLHEIVPSELALPRPLLLERLAGGGYHARHRPPPRESRRDLLVVGIAAAATVEWSLRLAKASWMLTLAELAKDLMSSGRTRSDFVWIEADRLGGWTVALIRTDQLLATAAPARSASDRRLPRSSHDATTTTLDPATFLRVHGFLPALIERSIQYPPELPVFTDDDPTAVSAWLRAALALALARKSLDRADGNSSVVGRSYEQVHVCGMVSATVGNASLGRQTVLAALGSGVAGRVEAARAQTSVVWLPAELEQLERWVASSDGGAMFRLIDDATTDGGGDTGDRVATGLLRYWLALLQPEVGDSRHRPRPAFRPKNA